MAPIRAGLGYLLGETRYLDAAERTLNLAWPQLQQLPYAHTSLLIALEEHLYPPELFIIRGDEHNMGDWTSACNEGYTPRRLAFAIPNNADNLPDALSSKKPGTTTVAYRCHGMRCDQPIRELGEVIASAVKQSP